MESFAKEPTFRSEINASQANPPIIYSTSEGVGTLDLSSFDNLVGGAWTLNTGVRKFAALVCELGVCVC